MSDNTIKPLGEWLKQRREELGISLEKAETETRIRAQYLRALESDDVRAMPNHVVGRGFLRNYASYLGLNIHEAASRYTALAGPAELAPQPIDKPASVASDLFRPVPLHNLPGRRRLRGIYAFGLILLPVALLLAWGWWNYPLVSDWANRALFSPRPTPTRSPGGAGLVTATLTPAGEDVGQATSIPTLVAPSTSQEPTVGVAISPSPTMSPTPSPTPSPPIYTGVFVELNCLAKSWVQVSVDGVREFQGELEPGTRRSWYGDNRVDLRIGNGGGIEVTVNGQKLGTLGAIGEVVDRTFQKAGEELTIAPGITSTLELTPTATLTPTAPTAPPPTAPISPTTTITP